MVYFHKKIAVSKHHLKVRIKLHHVIIAIVSKEDLKQNVRVYSIFSLPGAEWTEVGSLARRGKSP